MIDFHGVVGASIIASSIWVGGHFIGEATKVQPVGMALVSLDYEDGVISQVHEIHGTDVLIADWAASINRSGRHLCSGGSSAPYKSFNKKSMTPSEWTGQDCPKLQVGDELTAAWQWDGSDKIVRRISGKLTLTEEHLKKGNAS